jgi:hypothetical protein
MFEDRDLQDRGLTIPSGEETVYLTRGRGPLQERRGDPTHVLGPGADACRLGEHLTRGPPGSE